MIKIAHLYYDLMNLYGEHANVDALKNKLKKQFKMMTYETLQKAVNILQESVNTLLNEVKALRAQPKDISIF